jgi:hypothetical protein
MAMCEWVKKEQVLDKCSRPKNLQKERGGRPSAKPNSTQAAYTLLKFQRFAVAIVSLPQHSRLAAEFSCIKSVCLA